MAQKTGWGRSYLRELSVAIISTITVAILVAIWGAIRGDLTSWLGHVGDMFREDFWLTTGLLVCLVSIVTGVIVIVISAIDQTRQGYLPARITLAAYAGLVIVALAITRWPIALLVRIWNATS